MKKNTFKILIFRPAHFGDIVFGFKSLHSLRNKFKQNIQIDWMTDHSYVEFMRSQPLIDNVIGMQWLLNPNQNEILQFDYDSYNYIYDAQNNYRSRQQFAKYKGVLIRKPHYKWNKFWMLHTNIKFMQKPQVSVDSYEKPLAKLFNFSNKQEYEPYLDFTDLYQNFKNKNIIEQLPKDYIGIVTGASMPLKLWPRVYWLNLVSKLYQTFNLPIIALGSSEDKLTELQVPYFFDLAGQLSWAESSYVLSNAKGFIGGDTGLTQLADYLKIPCVHIRGGSAFGFPKNPTTSTLYKNLKCQPCSKFGKGLCVNLSEPMACLTRISPDESLNALKKLL